MPVIMLLFYSLTIYGSTTWIHAVGIDEINPDQNYLSFYQGAVDFQRQCATSKLKPDCHLSIDTTPNHSNQKEVVSKIKTESGNLKKNSTEILTLIREKLKSSRSGDTIVLSIANHGAPGDKNESCMYISRSDRICSDQIEKLLMEYPPSQTGVNFFINANGCGITPKN